MWKTIPTYSSYEVSSKGCIRNKSTKHVLKPRPQQSGHLLVWLRCNGVTKAVNIHSLVLDAFVGPRPSGLVCTHLNHVPSDNRVENLKWDTQSNNIKASYRENGRKVVTPNLKGSQHGLSKPTEEQVLIIRELALYGNKQSLLAKDFGVSPMTVSRIVNRVLWSHI